MLKFEIDTKTMLAAMDTSVRQAQYSAMVAVNKSAEIAKEEVRKEMRRVFDRPTPWFMNSLRVKAARDRSKPVAELAYKDAWSNSAGEVGGRTMVQPHVDGGNRHYKGMEVRLNRIGILPNGWNTVPGGAAKLDANGNMSPGQISQLLNVLGSYTESGFNKANINTRKRLAKGNAKKNVYGFTYWVNPVGGMQGRHLQPGVYQRVTTGFGTSLKPILIFVKQAKYKSRLNFYGIAQGAFSKAYPDQFSTAFDQAMRTAFPRTQTGLF
jgi:hypothetical protein